MAEEQTYSETTELLTALMGHDIVDQLNKCVLMNKTELNHLESHDKYIPASTLAGIMETLMAKFSSEVSEITTATIKNQERSFMEFEARKEGLIKRRKDQLKQNDNIENSKSLEINYKYEDHLKIVQNFSSVMEQFVTDEISNCVLVGQTESNNEYSNEKQFPISMIEVVMGALITNISSNLTEKLAIMTRNLEDKVNAIVKDFEARMDSLIKEENDLLKKNNDLFKENNDLLMRINGIEHKDRTLSTMLRIYTDHNKEYPEELSHYVGKKNSSIICRFASRTRKYEILSTRKVKGKKCDPLPKAAI